MKKETVSEILLTLLLVSTLSLACNVQPVRASGTIYIRPDGTVEGTDKIQRDGNIYTFADDIFDSILVQRSNIIVDGNGYTLQGSGWGRGFYLNGVNHITIQNTNIKGFQIGVFLVQSSSHIVCGNNITNNKGCGVCLFKSSSNILSDNVMADNTYNFGVLGSVWDPHLSHFVNDVDTSNTVDGKPVYYLINKRDMVVSVNAGYVALVNCTSMTVQGLTLTNNRESILLAFTTNSTVVNNDITANIDGINLFESSGNTISGNSITNSTDAAGIQLVNSVDNTISANNMMHCWIGIYLYLSSGNNLSGNSIANNDIGVLLRDSHNNRIHHNNFINNSAQARGYGNVWDDGYPSGGNYWSDHVTVDDYSGVNQDEPGGDGIVDEPYIINYYNRDDYPLVEPWSPVISATMDIDPDTLNLKSRGKWITCYIELPDGYNVSDIDVSTIVLEDTIPVYLIDVPAPHPVPTEIGDYDNDTIPDLMVKFNRTLVAEFILSHSITDDHVTLTITGEVAGTPFKGEDIIEVMLGAGGSKRRR